MSKVRQQDLTVGDTLPDPTPDSRHWVIYTRKRAGVPFKWAGYIDAPDVELALQYAREHYGLDEACVGILTHEHEDATDGPYEHEPLAASDASGDDGDPWTVLTLNRRGGTHVTAGTVRAPNAATAIERASATFADGRIRNVRVVPANKIYETTADDMVIWRHHDMSYKLARGYSKVVRAKWTRIRDTKAYEQYQQEDIGEHF